MFWDATYVFAIIGALVSALASWNVSQTFRNFEKRFNRRGMTAEDCAAAILHRAGIYDGTVSKCENSI